MMRTRCKIGITHVDDACVYGSKHVELRAGRGSSSRVLVVSWNPRRRILRYMLEMYEQLSKAIDTLLCETEGLRSSFSSKTIAKDTSSAKKKNRGSKYVEVNQTI